MVERVEHDRQRILGGAQTANWLGRVMYVAIGAVISALAWLIERIIVSGGRVH